MPSLSASALDVTITAAPPSEICDGIAGGDVAGLVERRAEAAERLGRGLGADTLVRR